jgi:diadenosine tetraphosphate (Ap4A) HIT family hydrolase
MQFLLDSRLAADAFVLGDMLLSRILLMNDARFPWLIVVPRRPELRELIDLASTERSILMEEIARASSALKEATRAEKLNVAALGNQVEQLHVHVIARFAGDPAWPHPVWGRGPATPYAPDEAARFSAEVSRTLGFI